MTSDLIHKASRLQNQVSVLANAREHRNRLDRYKVASDRLLGTQRTIAAQTELIGTMRDDDPFAVDHLGPRARAATSALDTAASDLAAAVDQHAIDRVCDDLTALSQDLRALIERRWSQIASQTHLADVTGLLQALTQVDSYRDRANTLLHRVNSLERTLSQEAISDATTYRTFQQQLRSVLRDVDDLEISDKPGLEEFLKDAAAGRATLTHLTPSITAWINEQGLLDHFLIRPGSPRA